MHPHPFPAWVHGLILILLVSSAAEAQLGRRFASEKKTIKDPATGVPLTFLTSSQDGERKIYPTHPQWTADGQWIVFFSERAPQQVLAVNEKSGVMVQVTETGHQGALWVGQKSMRLFLTRRAPGATNSPGDGDARPRSRRFRGPVQMVAIDLAGVFADSARGRMKPAAAYEQVFGLIPQEMAGGELAIDASEQFAYFRMTADAAARLLPEGTQVEPNFGPRSMGEGPSGIAKMNLTTGEVAPVIAVPFQVGHIQSNPWRSNEIVFCWETGGKSPQRTWTVNADGSGLRPVFPESEFDWVTHEAVIGPDEVALAILGHRNPGVDDGWGKAGTRVRPTGLGIVNLRTRKMLIVGQTRSGSGLWHVHGSPDGRWAVGDDFDRNLWLIDRRTSEMMRLTAGHKTTADDHPHPTFHPDGTRIQFQSAMLSTDGHSMDICVVAVPRAWLKRQPRLHDH
ncbi:MAG TPA: hypothetical protein VEH04_14935 [Verrucomicrobiae bacterium]|nr:hypothetical protein [Verrucomicrobiae bacterium]